jgi:hypothetical protein
MKAVAAALLCQAVSAFQQDSPAANPPALLQSLLPNERVVLAYIPDQAQYDQDYPSRQYDFYGQARRADLP